MKRGKKQHKKSLPEIVDISDIDTYNAESERLACEEFQKGEVAKLFKNEYEYILGIIVSRTRDLKAGKMPLAIRAYDADTLNRLLSADTVVSYSVAEYDEKNECIDDTFWGETRTQETQQQTNLVEAFFEYAMAGAIYAKHIKSTSVRVWAHFIDKLEHCQNRSHVRCHNNEADELINLEQIAIDRLRRDMIIKRLPPFKKSRAKGHK